MTTVFVYEYCCAAGLGRDPSDPAHSLFREGRAMRDALAEDFRRVPDLTVLTLDGSDTGNELDAYVARLRECDEVVVIAPELEGILAERCHEAEFEGRVLLGPTVDAVELTADKLELARHWQAAGVPTPRTWLFEKQSAEWEPPLVLKPRFGAGSTATFLVRGSEDLVGWLFQPGATEGEMIAQDFAPGRAASVAFLVGPRQTLPLLPALQLLSADGRFAYRGGMLPLPPPLAERAVRLGRRAVDCVPGLRGFVGVDLVLGESDDGSADCAIEINPRLTTSYIGLRQLAAFNLAETMRLVALGATDMVLSWKVQTLQFSPDGRFEYLEAGIPTDR